MKTWMVTLVIGLSLVGCGKVSEPTKTTLPGGGSGQIVTQAENNSKLTVAPGERFAVRLASQAGTGYTWDFVTEPDTAVIKLVSTTTEEAAASPTPAVGGSETMIWEFEAVAAGQSEIQLHYVRLFEGIDPATQTFTLPVTIK